MSAFTKVVSGKFKGKGLSGGVFTPLSLRPTLFGSKIVLNDETIKKARVIPSTQGGLNVMGVQIYYIDIEWMDGEKSRIQIDESCMPNFMSTITNLEQ